MCRSVNTLSALTDRSAAADLNKFSDYGGPKTNGQITPGYVISAAKTPGDSERSLPIAIPAENHPDGRYANSPVLPRRCQASVQVATTRPVIADWLKSPEGCCRRNEYLRFQSSLHSQQSRPLAISSVGLHWRGECPGDSSVDELWQPGAFAHQPLSSFSHSGWICDLFGSQSVPRTSSAGFLNPGLTRGVFAGAGWCIGGFGLKPFAGRIHNHVTGAAKYSHPFGYSEL